MRSIRTILVPVDFSPASEPAMSAALTMAERLGAELLAVHVHELQSFTGPELPGAGELMTEPLKVTMLREAAETAAQMEKLLQGIEGSAGREVEVVEAYGEPSGAIMNLARERAVDMIVMGTHARKGLSHLVLGSIAERVVREAPCPVLTIKAGLDQAAA